MCPSKSQNSFPSGKLRDKDTQGNPTFPSGLKPMEEWGLVGFAEQGWAGWSRCPAEGPTGILGHSQLGCPALPKPCATGEAGLCEMGQGSLSEYWDIFPFLLCPS